MRRILSQILPLFVAVLALIPPINFYILPPPFEYWPLMMLITAFFGIRLLFMKTNIFIKCISVFSFIICFFAASPYISFNQYVSILACCYFYVGLTHMDSWKPMFITLKSLLVLNLIILGMQYIGSDQLLNFGLGRISVYGTVGHHMQMSSFAVILGACLSILHPAFFLFPVLVGIMGKSAWAVLCGGIGLLMRSKSKWFKIISIFSIICSVIICFKFNKINEALSIHSGRLAVWEESINLLNERPLQGWGPGSYKYIFPALNELPKKHELIPWKTAHNDFVQFAFELGYPLFVLLMAGWLFVFVKAIQKKQWIFFVGFVVISLDMLVHFPARMIQCVPLMILYLAYHDN